MQDRLSTLYRQLSVEYHFADILNNSMHTEGNWSGNKPSKDLTIPWFIFHLNMHAFINN